MCLSSHAKKISIEERRLTVSADNRMRARERKMGGGEREKKAFRKLVCRKLLRGI